MNEEDLIYKIGKPILKPIGIIQGIFILVVFASPVIWIWKDWVLAWKVGLTGIVGIFFCWFLYWIVKNYIKDTVHIMKKN